jgi:hypothetical protein
MAVLYKLFQGGKDYVDDETNFALVCLSVYGSTTFSVS